MTEKDSQQSEKDVGFAAMHQLQSASLILAVMLATTGWTVGGAISLNLSKGSIAVTIAYPVGWAIGGLVTTLIVYWANPAMTWQQALAIIFGWVMSWLVSMAFCGAGGGFASATVTLVVE